MIADLIARQKFLAIQPFVSQVECKRIALDLETNTRWQDSTVTDAYGKLHYKEVKSKARISKTAYRQMQSEAVRQFTNELELRIATMLGVSTLQFEEWQATRYEKGGRFDYHNDCGNWKDDPKGGERKYTCLLYVQAPTKGGGTNFRKMNRYFEPTDGLMLIWDNLTENGDCNHDLIHSGIPVEEGVKMILVTWIRLGVYKRL